MASVMSDSRTVYHDEPLPADQVVLHVADPEPSWPAVRVGVDEQADRPEVLVAASGSTCPDHQTRLFGLFGLDGDEPLVVGVETGELAVTLARKANHAGWEVRVHPSAHIARAYFSTAAPLVLRYRPQSGPWR